MDTLASGAVNQTVIADITNEMEALKSEIESLKCRKPPKDFTFDCVSQWLEALKANPDEKAIHLLIERIDVKKHNGHQNNKHSDIRRGENLVAGAGFETNDLRVMSPTSYRTAPSRDIELRHYVRRN